MNAKGKTVWITGASWGIGRALAAEFAGLGVNLVVSACNKKALQLSRHFPSVFARTIRRARVI